MTIRRIERRQWQRYFRGVSKHLTAKQVDVVVSGLSLGVQVGAHHLPLLGLRYDPEDESFEIVTAHLSHRIDRPVEIFVDDSLQGLRSLEIRDRVGNRQIVELTDLLRLPAN